MSHIIKHLHIGNLFGMTNLNWELNPSVNVLVGQNGLGKSTILRVLYLTITSNSINEDDHDLFNNSKVIFEDSTINETLDIFPVLKKELAKNNSKKVAITKENGTVGPVVSIGLLTSLLTASPIPIVAGGLIALLSQSSSGNTNRQEVEASQTEDKRILIERAKTDINVEYISTANMNANAINHLTTSSGTGVTLLDFEFKTELQRLLDFDNNQLIDNFVSSVNNLFSETKKTIEFNENSSTNKLLVKLANGEEIPFNKLSSGERQVIFIFLKVVIASVDGALILMDEPEISLHLSWQEKLLNEIRRINTTSQIIIVTHSPAMLMNGWMDSFVDIANIMTDVSNDNALNNG